jgi:hypothetical protein
MIQADRVLSTPPTNTSATTPQSSRRGFLVQAAGVAAGGAAIGAGLPLPARSAAAAATDPAFVVIAEKRAADIAHGVAIDAQDEAERDQGVEYLAVDEDQRCYEACWAVFDVDWRLARTVPTTLAGVAAVLRFVNEIEDGGMEWPATGTVGAEGWHHQLRASIAAAIEAIMRQVGA